MRQTFSGLVTVAVFAVALIGSTGGQAAAGAGGGSKLWVQRYDGPGHDFDAAFALGVSPDGSKVFVTGGSATPGPSWDTDYTTFAYDPTTGAKLWVKRYNGPGDDTDRASALGVSPDGSKVFVTGESIGSSSLNHHTDYATVAYDAASGAKLWVKRYSGYGNNDDGAFALGVSPDGSKVFVTGTSVGSSGSPGYRDYATLAYDAASGAQLWVKRYDGPRNDDDGAFALGVSPDGSKVFVTGESDGSAGVGDYATVAYDAASGAELWVKRFTTPAGNAQNAAFALGVSPDGSKVFVTGASAGSFRSDYATVAYDAASGAELWVKRFNGTDNGQDVAQALGVSPDGSKVFVTGTSVGSSSYGDYATVAYDAASGAELWVKRYNGPGSNEDAPYALAVSPDGSKVLVTGESVGSSSNGDYATVAYDAASGAMLWVKRYNGPGDYSDRAFAVGVSPDGSKAFVAGWSWGGASSYDYATVAYETG